MMPAPNGQVREVLEEYRRLRQRVNRLRCTLRHPTDRQRWGTQDHRRQELEALEAELRDLEARHRWLA